MTDENSQIENSDRFAVFFLCAQCPRSGAVYRKNKSLFRYREIFHAAAKKKERKKKKKMRSTFRGRSSLIRFQCAFLCARENFIASSSKVTIYIYIYIVFRRTNSFILPKI